MRVALGAARAAATSTCARALAQLAREGLTHAPRRGRRRARRGAAARAGSWTSCTGSLAPSLLGGDARPALGAARDRRASRERIGLELRAGEPPRRRTCTLCGALRATARREARRVKSYPTRRDARRAPLRGRGLALQPPDHGAAPRGQRGRARPRAARAADDVHVAWVPGAFEIPLAARALARSGRYARARDARRRDPRRHAPLRLRLPRRHRRRARRDARHGVPVAFGVLTTDDVDQALRAPAAARATRARRPRGPRSRWRTCSRAIAHAAGEEAR